VRVQISADAGLFDEAVAQSRELLWLHTFGERLRDDPAGRGEAMPAGALDWKRAPTPIPEDRRGRVYDDAEWTLAVGNGRLIGVAPEVWAYEVSGWPVLQRWLEHRTRKGRGQRSSELDVIRPQRWDPAWTAELLHLLRVLSRSVKLHPIQDELLGRICTGPLIAADDLPSPTDDERKVPKTLQSARPDTLRLV
jgi:hypothetical protein